MSDALRDQETPEPGRDSLAGEALDEAPDRRHDDKDRGDGQDSRQVRADRGLQARPERGDGRGHCGGDGFHRSIHPFSPFLRRLDVL